MKDNPNELEKTIRITFKNKNLLKTALTHRSYLNEAKDNLLSNERLEFLGDAVLELIVSDYLYRTYLHLNEGRLTNLRSAIVKTQTLAKIASNLTMGKYLFLSKGEETSGGRENISLLADAFEALLGAIYLDQGIERVRKFISTYLLPLLPDIIETRAYLDYKSNLQAIIQEKREITPTYKVIKESGPDHDKTFYVVCMADSVKLGRGKGKNKQAAEQEAAKEALARLKVSGKFEK